MGLYQKIFDFPPPVFCTARSRRFQQFAAEYLREFETEFKNTGA
jgi:hypothetical protein